MATNVKNNRGFSLLEMLIAVVIIAISILALSGVMVNSISANLGNELRNASVRLTNETAEVLLALPLEGIESCGITADPGALNYKAEYSYDDQNECLGAGADYLRYPKPLQTVKGFTQGFNITWEVLPLSSALRQITITVTYTNRGEDHTNSAVIYKHRTL
jgi:prepilin-type N-terminal cleavage/methylation domain-containing protein